MTTITLPRATVEQALEAMRRAVPTGKITLYEWDRAISDLSAALAMQRLTDAQQEMERSIESLKAALAQQTEPAQKPITRLFGTLPVHDAQQAEPVPFGCVTVRRLSLRHENHADQYQFYPAGQSPYLDNVDECHTVYTVPPQQAEPVELKHRHEWFSTGGMEPGQFRCIHCGVWGQEQTDPQVEDRLARHGIPMPGDPK